MDYLAKLTREKLERMHDDVYGYEKDMIDTMKNEALIADVLEYLMEKVRDFDNHTHTIY